MGSCAGPRIASLTSIVDYQDAANYNSYPDTGSSWFDLVNGNVGTMTTATSSGSGVTQSLLFDGADSSVNLGTGNGLNVTTSWTLEAWIRPNTFGESSGGRVLQRSTGSLTGFICSIDNSVATNGIRLDTYAVASFAARLNNVVDTGSWQQLVWAFSSGSVTFYKNGASVGSSSITSPVAYTGNTYIGNDSGATRTFDGNIAVVKLHNTTLTDTQIAQNYNALKGRYSLT